MSREEFFDRMKNTKHFRWLLEDLKGISLEDIRLLAWHLEGWENESADYLARIVVVQGQTITRANERGEEGDVTVDLNVKYEPIVKEIKFSHKLLGDTDDTEILVVSDGEERKRIVNRILKMAADGEFVKLADKGKLKSIFYINYDSECIQDCFERNQPKKEEI